MISRTFDAVFFIPIMSSSLEDSVKQAFADFKRAADKAEAASDALNTETDKPRPDPDRVALLRARLEVAVAARDVAVACPC